MTQELTLTKETGPLSCKDMLMASGFSQLTELLNKENETAFLGEVKEFALSGNPNPMLLEPYKIELQIVPAQKLSAICARTENNEVSPTPLGKIVLNIYKKMEEEGIEGYIILTSGGGKEALGLKPPQKSKFGEDGGLQEDFLTNYGPPKMDADLTLVLKNTLSEERLQSIIDSQEEKSLKAVVITSRLRAFARVDIGKFSQSNGNIWYSWGHFTYPEYEGQYGSEIPLVNQVMGNETSRPYLLLVPNNTDEGFTGVSMNFFPQLDFKEMVSFPQENSQGYEIKRFLRPAIIPWFSVMFPNYTSLSEAHVHHLHLLRSCTWENTVPMAISYEDNDYWQLFHEGPASFNPEKIKEISWKTAIKMAREITYPTASTIIEDPEKQTMAAKRLFEAMRPILNGDPYLGLIYLLSAGENPTDAPVYGMGFIDKRGFFPELFDFLHQEGRLGKLISVMEKCPFGKAQKGWETFINFFYQEVGGNEEALFKLLRPSFCSPGIFLPDAKKFLFRSSEPYRRIKPTDKIGVYCPN